MKVGLAGKDMSWREWGKNQIKVVIRVDYYWAGFHDGTGPKKDEEGLIVNLAASISNLIFISAYFKFYFQFTGLQFARM